MLKERKQASKQASKKESIRLLHEESKSHDTKKKAH
jgi:hypothetical protein